MRSKDNRIPRSASKLIPPPSSLDRGLHLLVLLLWCSVGTTWMTARARLMNAEIATKLEATNGRRSVLYEIDWWKTGHAKLKNSPGIEANRTRRFGRAAPVTTTTGAAGAEQAVQKPVDGAAGAAEKAAAGVSGAENTITQVTGAADTATGTRAEGASGAIEDPHGRILRGSIPGGRH